MGKAGYFVSFALGALVGACVTYKVVKDNADRKLEEEIQTIRDIYRRSDNKVDEAPESEKETPNAEYEKARNAIEINRNKKPLVDYTKYNGLKGDEALEPVQHVRPPFVIPPEELGEIDEYDIIELTYYEADGVLCDYMNEPIGDDTIVCEDFKDYFGKYEEDAVYIQNDARGCYYEIILSTRSYHDDVAPFEPHPVKITEDEEDGENTED